MFSKRKHEEEELAMAKRTKSDQCEQEQHGCGHQNDHKSSVSLFDMMMMTLRNNFAKK